MCEVLLEASAFDFMLEEAYIHITRVSQSKVFKVLKKCIVCICRHSHRQVLEAFTVCARSGAVLTMTKLY